MLVPLSWLKEYVDIPVGPAELSEKLFSCGFEVEEYYEVGREISNVVVGLVETCEKVEGTHLSVCRVNAGAHGSFQVMCGADNVCAGGKFPLALVGATVIKTAKDHVTVEGTMTIEAGKLRGYDSCGMLCSGTELGLNDDLYPGASYNGLLVLPEDAVPGEDVKPILGLDDVIFDITITANRPDCQSIFGIAREVSAVLGTALHAPDLSYTEGCSKADVTGKELEVRVLAPDLCPRFTAHYVYDVKIGESPAWMKRRLALVGIGSISNIVDITNYVLKELGQPMHAYDEAFLQGGRIEVRRARKDEPIITLDEKEFLLDESNLVICDGEKPVGLAGIMGGLNSEIRDTTKAVVFEAAKFARDNVRKSSRKLGQSSDSSAVFAKGVNEYTTVMAMKRALHLTEELHCGTVSSSHIDVNTGNSLEPRTMTASLKKVNAVLGIEVPADEALKILTRLDFDPLLDGDTLTIHVPAYREDMDSYPDISEELIRMYGYEHVQPTFLPSAQVTVGGRNAYQHGVHYLKEVLTAAGASEAVHYHFFSPADLDLLKLPANAAERTAIRILNPITEDLSLMRTTLVPGMLHAVQRNQKRGTLSGRLFELGRIFIPKALPLTDYPDERDTLAAAVFGPDEDFFSLKGMAEILADALDLEFRYRKAARTYLHPGRTAEILLNGQVLGVLGQLSYEIQDELDLRLPVYVMQLDISLLSPYFNKVKRYRPLPLFNEEKRDFAFVMDRGISCEAVEDLIREACPYVSYTHLFDVYEGLPLPADKKSMAFNVVFTPTDHAFTDAEVEGFVDDILALLKSRAAIVLRT
ncbi:MAG: phenylalanine--tRNA ligase subunit beta [Lachnospiraceae bacterium]|nr:phenylalanine--tRNA ligase subunit beta [Lachnospiraceae bacterium]